MDMEAHSLEPIVNTVEVVNGAEFRDSVLARRIQPLLTARTLGELYQRFDSVAHSLSVLGDVRYVIESDPNAPEKIGVARPIRTSVILSNTRPRNLSAVEFVTNRDMASLSGRYVLHNRLGLGEQFLFSGSLQPNPTGLGSGIMSASVPTPIGWSKVITQGFFFNQDRPWANYGLASHGLSTKIHSSWTRNLSVDFGIEAISRHVHSISEATSDTVRATAGSSSVKTAAVAGLQHIGSNYKLDLLGEMAGKPGDALYSKFLGSLNVFRSLLSNQGLIADLGVSAGYLKGESKIFDNFVLGGVKDVYGVALNSMGPKDGHDFIGGQSFYHGRATLTAKIPGRPLSPLRLTALMSAGALGTNTSSSVQDNLRQLAMVSPVVSAAVGLTYITSAATCEVMYILPLRFNPGDICREGLHVGVGLSLS